MLKFNKLKEAQLYRVKNNYSLPYDARFPTKGNLITVFGDTLEDTSNFFKQEPFIFRNYKKYYIDKRIRITFMGKPVIIVNNQAEMFKEGFGKDFNIMLAKTPTMAGNYNTIYELNQYMDIMNTNEKLKSKSLIIKADLKYQFIMSRLEELSNKFPSHNKFLFLPINNYISNPRSIPMWSVKSYLENNMIAFLRKMATNPDDFKNLKGWTFVFVNLNEIFFIKSESFDSTTIDTIKALFKKMRSKHGYINTDDCDDELITDDESNEDDEIIESNRINTIKTLETASKELEESELPEEVKKDIQKKTIIKVANIVKPNITVNKQIPKETENKQISKDNMNNQISKNKDTEQVSTDDTKTGINRLTTRKITSISSVKNIPVVNTDNKLVSKEEITDETRKAIKDELKKINTPSVSIQRLARIKKIEKEMDSLKIDNESVSTMTKKAESKIIDNHEVKVDVINPKIKNINFDNFEKGYNDKLFNYDLMNILRSFSKKDRPLYLIKLDKEDTSNSIDQQYTYTAVFEDEKGKRHTMTFNMPKLVNNKFIHLKGSDKLFINQVIPLPITKVSPDEVQISSNYNKVFIRRFGKLVSNKIATFHKTIPNVDSRIVKITKGNNVMNNSEYMTTIEYDELSSKYTTIELCNDNTILYFNQEEIRQICDAESLTFDNDKEIPFGIMNLKNGEKKLLKIDINTDTLVGEKDVSPIDFIVGLISIDMPKFADDFSKLASNKRMIYTRATIMAKKVPMVLLLGFLIGLEPLLNKLKIDYTFSQTRPTSRNTSSNNSVVKFSDGYLVYNNSTFSNALILNGLYDVPTEEYEFLEFSTKDIYYDIFQKMFGRRNIGTAFENFNQLFVDPITKEILEDFKMPTNFIDIMIYANSLLENNTYDLDGDLKNYRIRTNELLNAHLYKLLAKSYERYRATADNNEPAKFSIKKDDLITDIFGSQIFEEYSTLNPIYEIDRMRATSYKGAGGCNVDRAFNIEKRAYNDTMMGIFAQSSPISSNIGISRILSLNPNVTSLRGYIEPGSSKNVDKLDETKILSGAELLLPMTVTHDDAQRVSMASTQSRHTISTVDSDAPLFGYGMDKVLAKVISDRFAFKAKENGTIEEINEKLGYMLLKYDSGKTDVVDLTNRQALNTGSGFYITNKLTPNINDIGHRFKKDDIVARNNDFFKYDKITGDTVYKSGPLARVAVIHGSSVFEDSTMITERLAERMSSYVTEKKDVAIGKNSNIYHMVKVGDEVKTGDPLIIFDESYTDDYLNKLLGKINEDDKKDIISAGRTPVKSKVNGKIIDIKIYHTVDKSELSESLQSIITSYDKTIKQRLKRFNDAGVNIKDLTSLNDTDKKTELVNGKIKGIKMGDNSVLIEFYIQTIDKFSVGDKLTYAVALKGINHGLIPKGQEPYIGSDPDEKIDAFMSVSGFYSRMTNSFALGLILNTIMIGAEKKIKDILNS